MAKKMNMHGSSENEGKAMGKGGFANMPQDVKFQAYPKANEFGPGIEDDTMTRIDGENKRAKSKTRSHLSNQH
jgi:hypothetical protein